MPDRGVAGQRLHVVDRARAGAADQGPLDAPVLVAELDLQVQDVLAVALEAEMARLDDAGVHGTDRDLVNLLALDAEVVGDATARSASPCPGSTHRDSGHRKCGTGWA